jgi:hypothetical protein
MMLEYTRNEYLDMFLNIGIYSIGAGGTSAWEDALCYPG